MRVASQILFFQKIIYKQHKRKRGQIFMKEKKCGIYCIENVVNTKKYIGQSVNIDNRWSSHLCELNAGTHYNDYLQNARGKYGPGSFKFYILEFCEEDSLDERESYYIEKYKTLDRDFGYNLMTGGGSNRNLSEETKKKMSENCHWRGKTLPEDVREKISKSRAGKCVGEDNPFYGKHHSKETIEMIRKKAKERCKNKENHPFYGKHHSEKTKEKIRNAHIGRKATDEAKQKMSERSSGKNNPRCRPVYCPELDEEFWGAKEVELKYGIGSTSICQCINNKTKHAGKHPITGIQLTWVPLEK